MAAAAGFFDKAGAQGQEVETWMLGREEKRRERRGNKTESEKRREKGRGGEKREGWAGSVLH